MLKSPVRLFEPFDPYAIPIEDHPESHKYEAIWDTGATNSVVSKRVIRECGLRPIGRTKVRGVDGESTSSIYMVNIMLTNGVGFPFLKVTEGDFGGDVLIGMDLIGHGDFAVSNYNGKTTMTFRTPSAKKIDFYKEEEQKQRVLDQMKKKAHPKTQSLKKIRENKRKKKK